MLLKGLNSLVVIRINIIILSLIFASNFGFSQVKISFDTIKKNSDGIKLSDFENWSKKNDLILFFCPVSDGISDSLYSKKTEGFIKDDRFQGFKGEFKLVFYKEFDNNSKNPFIYNSYQTNDSIINQLQCFVLLSNDENLIRAKKIFKDKFEYTKVGVLNSLFELKISDFVCPKDLPSKMVFYLDFLNEIFNPIYSIEEIVEKLTHRILVLESKVNKLNCEIIKMNKSEQENQKNDSESKKKQ